MFDFDKEDYKFKTDFFDDKKGKWQSCEYTIEEEKTQFYIREYGETEEEAKEMCLKQFDNFIEQILKFRKTL